MLFRSDGDGTGLLGDGGLLGVGYVHDDAAFEHFGEAGLEAETGAATVVFRHGEPFLGDAFSYRLSAISEPGFILQRVRDSRYPSDALSAVGEQPSGKLLPEGDTGEHRVSFSVRKLPGVARLDSRGRLSPHEPT